ncbi:MAG: glycosyltransferase family 4 protein [Chlorobium limicola]|nr:glycosyltransferase family 4 protein [Chlorobium limicola]
MIPNKNDTKKRQQNMVTRTDRNKQLCLFYAAGPGDIVSTFSFWQKGEDDPHQVAVTYSSLFFDTCRTLGAKGVAISCCPRKDSIATEQFTVENNPKSPPGKGIAFHLQQIGYVREIIARAKAVDADYLIMADATGHFFPLLWFAPGSMKLIPSLHCTLWPESRKSSPVQKLLSMLNRNLFSKRATAILCISRDVRRQLHEITGGKTVPVHPFIPHYRKELFEQIPPPPASQPFNLLYAGRMETAKGIYDLLDIARKLRQTGNSGIVLHLCGTGPEKENLRNALQEQGLSQIMQLHGYCARPAMLRHIAESHAFIVPTRTSFEEGFNKVVAEAILAGRPVITSSVCPALEYVKEAVIEVPPDNAAAYFEAVIQLTASPQLYHQKQEACKILRKQFYDPGRSWGAALLNIVKSQPHG